MYLRFDAITIDAMLPLYGRERRHILRAFAADAAFISILRFLRRLMPCAAAMRSLPAYRTLTSATDAVHKTCAARGVRCCTRGDVSRLMPLAADDAPADFSARLPPRCRLPLAVMLLPRARAGAFSRHAVDDAAASREPRFFFDAHERRHFAACR